MSEDYWALFCITGDPVFYLMYRNRQTEQEQNIKTAWYAPGAELV